MQKWYFSNKNLQIKGILNQIQWNVHNYSSLSFYLTLCANSPNLTYGMYDIFNNAFTHGGKLNITFDRFFHVPEREAAYFTTSQLQKMTKYKNRNNFKDVTLRLGLLVSVKLSKTWQLMFEISLKLSSFPVMKDLNVLKIC